MDYLEFTENNKVNPATGRFGTNGIRILKDLDMDLWLRNNPTKRIDDNNMIQYRDFRNAMMILFEDEALDMMDYLESLDGKGQSGNRRFGMLGMNRLSRLTAESPHWDKVGGGHLSKQVRQDMISAAKTALDSNKAHILLEVHGGDGIFERGDIREWVSKSWSNCSAIAP